MPSVLVVDDDPHCRELTARALMRLRLQCSTAGDGDQALSAFERSPFDAVVTDLRMPRRHGHALAVELLQHKPKPKIVVLTGLVEPRLVDDLVQRGVDEIVQKPANYDSLANTVLRLVAKEAPPAPGAASKSAPPAEPRVRSRLELLQAIEGSLVELTGLFAERLEGVFDFADELSEPPPAVKNFITRQAEIEEAAEAAGKVAKQSNEARLKTRVRCDANAIAVPIDDNFCVSDPPFKLAVRDLSESGIRLLHTRATNAKYLALSWSATSLPFQQLTVISRVMRCRPLSPFYDIGGQFVLADG